jgi:hypothetical protein
MDQSGIEDTEAVLIEAALAERFVAQLFGGTLTEPFDRVGDVELRDETILDVKRVPVGFRFVNGGDKDPLALVVVVQFRSGEPELVGYVPRGAWSYGLPPCRNAKACWFVPRSAVLPIPSSPDLVPAGGTGKATRPMPEQPVTPSGRLVLGRDDPPALDRTLAKRIRDRLAKRRQRLRDAASPLPLPIEGNDSPRPIRYGYHKRKEADA